MERELELMRKQYRRRSGMQHLSVWVTDREKASLLRIANQSNCSMTDLMRRALTDVIEGRVPQLPPVSHN